MNKLLLLATTFISLSFLTEAQGSVINAIQSGNTELALQILEAAPHEAHASTPGMKLIDSHFGIDDADDYDYVVGYEEGTSAFEYAVRHNNLIVMEKMFGLGANPHFVRVEYDGTPSDWWVEFAYPKIHHYEPVKMVNAFFFRTRNYTSTALYWAIRHNNLDMVKRLVEYGCDTHKPYDALGFANGLGHKEIHEFLLSLPQ